LGFVNFVDQEAMLKAKMNGKEFDVILKSHDV
jgi:hypothetical protein